MTTFAMKTLLAAIALCGFAFTQGTPSPSTSQQSPAPAAATNSADTPAANVTSRIAAGSVIPVRLEKNIDARKMKVGEEVDAKVTQDLKAANGELIVAKDTKVVGHVTETQAHNKEQKDSQVGIRFEHAIMKNGTDMALPMSIQAIVAPPSANPSANNDNSAAAAEPAPGAASSSNARPSPGMGAGMPPAPAPPAIGSEATNPGQPAANARQPINANTRGVVGIQNLTLADAGDKSQGSVITAQDRNVKLESGTLLLLRVNP